MTFTDEYRRRPAREGLPKQGKNRKGRRQLDMDRALVKHGLVNPQQARRSFYQA